MLKQGKVSELAQALRYLPTIMTIEQETLILRQLMALSDEEILAEEVDFYWILEQINLSHEYNWALLSDDEVSLMVAFVDFLKSVSMVKEKDLIEDSIYIFSLRPEIVED